jgi:Na+:H+ antiporter, NhaA family
MSIFIGQLAFADQSSLFEQAKLGIIMASMISAIIGLIWLYFSTRSVPHSRN